MRLQTLKNTLTYIFLAFALLFPIKSSTADSIPLETFEDAFGREWLVPTTSIITGLSYDQIQWTLAVHGYRLARQEELEELLGPYGTPANEFLNSIDSQGVVEPCFDGPFDREGFTGIYDDLNVSGNIGIAAVFKDGQVTYSPNGVGLSFESREEFLPNAGCGKVFAIKAPRIFCPTPLAGSKSDFDCDGRDDLVVWRPPTGTWYIRGSRIRDVFAFQWGLPGDSPFVGDYTGDGIPDLVVWRPASGVWYLLPIGQAAEPISRQWGLPGDIPISKDFDGDGIMDFAVYRPSTGSHYWLESSENWSGFGFASWGLTDDIPR